MGAPSTYADEGTIAHALAAMCLTEGKDAAAYIGRVIESEDYEHSKLSPSSAHRWMRCAGSHALEGRQAFTPRKFSMEVTEDMAAGVQIYLDNIRQYANGNTLLVEQRLPIGHITGEEGATGTGDAVIVTADGEELQLHDLKFGRGVEVEAEYNEQLQLYALGAIEQFAMLGEFKRVRMVIHQPRLRQAPSEWDCSIGELMVFAHKATQAAKLAHTAAKFADNWIGKPDDLQYLKPGEKQCKFCDAKATCPALAKFVEEGVGADFEVLPVMSKNALINNTVTIALDDSLGIKMQAVDLIEDWCRAIRAEVERRLLAGTPVPGFKLVQGKKGNRAWSDAEAVEATFKSMRLKQEEMYDFKLISPATAEKRLKDTPKRWARVQPLITQSEGKPSVAPVSDKRPALEIKPVEDDFINEAAGEDLV